MASCTYTMVFLGCHLNTMVTDIDINSTILNIASPADKTPKISKILIIVIMGEMLSEFTGIVLASIGRMLSGG